MKTANFLSGHQDYELESPNKIIPVSIVMKDFLNDSEN